MIIVSSEYTTLNLGKKIKKNFYNDDIYDNNTLEIKKSNKIDKFKIIKKKFYDDIYNNNTTLDLVEDIFELTLKEKINNNDNNINQDNPSTKYNESFHLEELNENSNDIETSSGEADEFMEITKKAIEKYNKLNK